jgi:hypothetical protein
VNSTAASGELVVPENGANAVASASTTPEELTSATAEKRRSRATRRNAAA